MSGLCQSDRNNVKFGIDKLLKKSTFSDCLIFYYLYSGILKFGSKKNDNLWCKFLDCDDIFIYSIIEHIDIGKISSIIQCDILALKHVEGSVITKKKHISSLLVFAADYLSMLFYWYDRLSDDNVLKVAIRNEMECRLNDSINALFQSIEGLKDSDISGIGYFTSVFHDSVKKYDFVHKNSNINDHDRLDYASGTYFFDAIRNLIEVICLSLINLKSIVSQNFDNTLYNRKHSPHITLLMTFVKLLEDIDDELNGFVLRHLQYYYEGVLMFKRKQRIQDRTIVSCLCKTSDECVLKKGTKILGGKDQQGNDIVFTTDNSALVSRLQLRTVRTFSCSWDDVRDLASLSKMRISVASYNMDDVYANNKKLFLFSKKYSNASTLGQSKGINNFSLIIASEFLSMKDGERTIRLSFFPVYEDLSLFSHRNNDNLPYKWAFLVAKTLNRGIRVSYTSTDKMVDIPDKNVQCLWDTINMCFVITCTISVDMPPMATFLDILKVKQITTPALQLSVKNTSLLWCWFAFFRVRYEKVKIGINVRNCRDLVLQNDLGVIDNNQSFLPFGPMPKVGSCFYIGSDEIFNKNLTRLSINIDWENLPNNVNGFGEYYSSYDSNVKNSDFKASLSFLQNRNWYPLYANKQVVNLFDFEYNSDLDCNVLLHTNRIDDVNLDLLKLTERNTFDFSQQSFFSATSVGGFLKIELCGPTMAFGHYMYPQLVAKSMALSKMKYIKRVINNDINAPYTPTIKLLSIDYSSEQEIIVSDSHNGASDDFDFILVQPYGCISLRERSAGVMTMGIGNIYSKNIIDGSYAFVDIELQHLKTPTFSLYISIDEASISGNVCDLSWYYLSDNKWMLFDREYMLSDDTDGLKKSGIIRFKTPSITNNNNTTCTSNFDDSVWIKILFVLSGGSVPVILGIYPQPVYVTRLSNNEQYELQSGRLQVADGVDISISQPLNSLGGKLEETQQQLYTRIRERLRHKDRAVSRWDYEHIVLECFPEVSFVKCFYSDDKITVAVVVDRTKIAENGRIFPEASRELLNAIKEVLVSRCSPFIRIEVINPTYEKVRVIVRVEFKNEEVNICRKELNRSIKKFISPWLLDWNEIKTIDVGRAISSLDVINHIRNLDYVKSVYSFLMIKKTNKSFDCVTGCTSVLYPNDQFSVLYSADNHNIITHNGVRSVGSNIDVGSMIVGENFVVGPVNVGCNNDTPMEYDYSFGDSVDDYYLLVKNKYGYKKKK